MPWPPFGVTRHGEPLLDLPLDGTVDTGIGFSTLYPGLVPEIEEREAARFSGYTWKVWLDQSRRDRVYGVAYRRLSFLLDSHRSDAVNKDADRRQRAAEARAQHGA